jgi:hypothetical protein
MWAEASGACVILTMVIEAIHAKDFKGLSFDQPKGRHC